jgi:hypothetical protein
MAASASLALFLAIPAPSAEARGAAGARGGATAHASVSGANRASYGGAGGYNRGNVNTGNVNRGKVNTDNVNRGNVNRGNVNTDNVNIGNDIDIDIDGDYGWRGDIDYPVAAGIAAGVVIGAVAVTTAAAVGSAYYALPPSGCVTVVRNGVSYYQCGSVYYQQTWQGSDVVYVVVDL